VRDRVFPSAIKRLWGDPGSMRIAPLFRRWLGGTRENRRRFSLFLLTALSSLIVFLPFLFFPRSPSANRYGLLFRLRRDRGRFYLILLFRQSCGRGPEVPLSDFLFFLPRRSSDECERDPFRGLGDPRTHPSLSSFFFFGKWARVRVLFCFLFRRP